MVNRVCPAHTIFDPGVKFTVQTRYPASSGTALHKPVPADGISFLVQNAVATQQMLADDPSYRVRLDYRGAHAQAHPVTLRALDSARPVMGDSNRHKRSTVDNLLLLASPPPAKGLAWLPVIGLSMSRRGKQTAVFVSTATGLQATLQLKRVTAKFNAGKITKNDAIVELMAFRKTHNETLGLLMKIMSETPFREPNSQWLKSHNLKAKDLNTYKTNDRALLTKIRALEEEIKALGHYIEASKITLRWP